MKNDIKLNFGLDLESPSYKKDFLTYRDEYLYDSPYYNECGKTIWNKLNNKEYYILHFSYWENRLQKVIIRTSIENNIPYISIIDFKTNELIEDNLKIDIINNDISINDGLYEKVLYIYKNNKKNDLVSYNSDICFIDNIHSVYKKPKKADYIIVSSKYAFNYRYKFIYESCGRDAFSGFTVQYSKLDDIEKVVQDGLIIYFAKVDNKLFHLEINTENEELVVYEIKNNLKNIKKIISYPFCSIRNLNYFYCFDGIAGEDQRPLKMLEISIMNGDRLMFYGYSLRYIIYDINKFEKFLNNTPDFNNLRNKDGEAYLIQFNRVPYF